MADNISQAQHITNLDFDIAQALQDLKDLETAVNETSKRIASTDFKVGDVVNNSGVYQQETQNMQKLYANRTAKENELQALINKNFDSRKKKEKEIADASSEAEKKKRDIIEQVYTANEKAYRLAQKGKNISDKSYTEDKKKVKVLQEQTDELVKQIKLSGTLTDEQQAQLTSLQAQLREQENAVVKYDTTKQPSVLSGAANFAKYTLQTEAWQLAKTGASEVVDVETQMMEISRVMNLTTESSNQMRNSIMGLGVEYGRNFDEVSDIALRFTQAGYEANDVLEMTREMLLGINTAELDADSGTTSLIGIMQQWGYEASDLEGIIDKLNYTADHNAITTQDLTDGLLQASSVAKIAGMSFEDTIGTLTAMKEASGRTGKEVGNAFKSILSYIQRDSSLKVFDSAGIDVYANKLTGELLPMQEILTNMATKWGSVGDASVDALVKSADEAQLFSEDFAAALGMEEEYEKMLRDVNDAEARGVTQAAAGVFRRNYFIALMEKFSKVTEVSTEAIGKEGYSMQENSRYMETYEAKMKQLQTSLTDLAVQFADSGALDMAKKIIDATTNLVNLSKEVGGLKTALIALLGIITLIKGQKILKGISEISSASRALFTAITTGSLTANAAMGALGIALIAISAAIAAVSYAAKSGERAIDDMTDAASKYDEVTGKLEEVNTELEVVNKSIEEIQKKGKLNLTDQENLDNLTKQADELERAVKYQEILEEKSAKDLADTAEKAWKKNQGKTWNGAQGVANADVSSMLTAGNYGENTHYKMYLSDVDEEYSNYKMYLSGKYEENDVTSQIAYLDTLNSKYKEIDTELKNIEIAQKNTTDTDELEQLNQKFISLTDVQGEYKNTILDVQGALSKNGEAIAETVATLEKVPEYANSDTLKEMQVQLDYIDAALADYAPKQKAATAETSKAINSLSDYQIAVKNGTISNKALTDSVSEQGDAFSATADNIDEYVSKISTMNGYIQTLNNGGSLTAEQVIKLIELYPELSTQITQTTDGFSIETSALQTLNEENINAAVAFKISQIDMTKIVSDETMKRIQKYEGEAVALATIADAQKGLEKAQSKQDNARSRLQGGVGGESDAKALSSSTEGVAAYTDALDSMQNEEDKVRKSFEELYKSIGTSSATSSAGTNANSSLSETKSILDELLSDFNTLNDMGLLSVSEQIEYLNNVLKNTALTTEDISEVQSKLYKLYKEQVEDEVEAFKNAQEEKIKAIEETYDTEIDGAKKVYEEKLALLDKEKNALSRSREDEDYDTKVNNINDEIFQLDVDNANGEISPAEYSKQKNKLLEELSDLELERKRDLEDRKYDGQKSALEKEKEAKIAALKEEKQTAIDIEQAKIDEIEAMFTEANVNMIAASALYAPQIFNQFQALFTNPLKAEIETIRAMIASLGGAEVDVKMAATNGNYVGAATGGETKSDGFIMLHNNEFVANSAITDGLRELVVNRDILNGIKSLASGGTINNNSAVTNNAGAKVVNVNVTQNFTQTSSSEAAAYKANRKLSQEIAKAVK